MRKFLNLALILGLLIGSAVAQSSGVNSKPAFTTKPAAAATTLTDELIAILPPSDLIAVVDVNRVFNELLPKLAEFNTGGIDKLAKDLSDFRQKTGIDPSKIQSAVLGVSVSGLQSPGVIILHGIELDVKQIEAIAKEYKAEYKTVEYKGKTLYTVVSKTPSPSAGPLSLKTDELSVVSLGNQRMGVGDLAMIKAMIDKQSGADKAGVSAEIARALGETRSSALVRFAMNIPENLRSQASDQGDLFKSVASIKMILGTFDAASDLSLSLDAIMRTASQSDAAELENSLKGLLGLVRGIFGGGGNPKSDFLGQLLDQIKIGSKLSDVSLSISLPRSIIDQLIKKPAPAEKK